MLVVRGHHFSFTVRDLERSRAFYEGVLGFEQIERPDFGFPGAWYQTGETQVHLIEKKDQEPAKPPLGRSGKPTPLTNHSAFQIEDYDEAIAHFEAHDIPVRGFGKEVGQMFVSDPDGNVIELIVPGGRLGRMPGVKP